MKLTPEKLVGLLNTAMGDEFWRAPKRGDKGRGDAFSIAEFPGMDYRGRVERERFSVAHCPGHEISSFGERLQLWMPQHKKGATRSRDFMVWERGKDSAGAAATGITTWVRKRIEMLKALEKDRGETLGKVDEQLRDLARAVAAHGGKLSAEERGSFHRLVVDLPNGVSLSGAFEHQGVVRLHCEMGVGMAMEAEERIRLADFLAQLRALDPKKWGAEANAPDHFGFKVIEPR